MHSTPTEFELWTFAFSLRCWHAAIVGQRFEGVQRRSGANPQHAGSVLDTVSKPIPIPGLPSYGLHHSPAASIDPNTPDGRLRLQVVGTMAEFERSPIKDQTRAGLEAAKAQGRTGGRPSVISEDKLTIALARRAKEESVSSIAKALGISRATLYRHLENAES
ncbi:recombinase family protein [Kitasatospora sp. NPDC056731]|uniref:recombinase family protein n=1 Tax=Kitasatospora sp. NPDC056731 TaxID=3155422 RepID=UPI0034358153